MRGRGVYSPVAAFVLCFSSLAWSQTAQQRVTTTMDGTWTWYEQGVNPNLPTTGLPPAGIVQAQSDPSSTFLFQPYNQNNVLYVGPGINQLSGTMTFTAPVEARTIAIATSSGWGPDSLMATIHFGDSLAAESEAFISPDWVWATSFNDPVVFTSKGRISPSTNSFQAGINSNQPSIAEVVLPIAPFPHPIVSIDFTWMVSASDTDRVHGGAAIFGLSSSRTGTGPFSPVSLTPSSFNEDIVVENTVPEPGTIGFLIALSCITLRRRG